MSNGSSLRSLSANEREVIMGFPAGYTSMASPRRGRGSVEDEVTRCSLIGNSWAVPVVVWLLGHLGAHWGLRRGPIDVQACVEAATGLPPAGSLAHDQQDLARELIAEACEPHGERAKA